MISAPIPHDDPAQPDSHVDRGAVLPLALVLTVVLGALAASITTYVATALRSTTVTQDRVSTLADAEARMRDALIELEHTGSCPGSASTAGNMGTDVSVSSCEMHQIERIETSRTFGLVMTGLHGNHTALDGRNNSPEPVRIGGDVFLGPNVTGTSRVNNLIALDDVIVQRGSCEGYEPERMTWLGSYPFGDESRTPEGARPLCREWNWLMISPPPVDVPVPSSPGSQSNSGSCRVYSPGTYENITIGNGSNAYFQSGVYRISGRLHIRNNTAVTAGHPGGGVASILPGDNNAACRPAQLADIHANPAGAGALFVFVGDGRFDFGNNTATEVFGLPVGGRVLSVIAFPQDSLGVIPTEMVPSAFAGNSNRTSRGVTANLMDGNPNGHVTFRGEFWAPASWAALHVPSSGRAGAGFLGGLTIARTNYHLTGNAQGGLLFMVETGPSNYRYRLRTTATAESGLETTVSVVVSVIEADVYLDSWRVCEAADCRS